MSSWKHRRSSITELKVIHSENEVRSSDEHSLSQQQFTSQLLIVKSQRQGPISVFFGNGFGGTRVEVTTSEVVVTIAGVVGENVPLLVLRFEICAEVSAPKRA